MKDKEPIFIKIGVALVFLLMILINALANILPINGITTGQVSDAYSNLFTPAGLTFSIWGIIYFLLALYVVYQLGVFGKKNFVERRQLFKEIGFYFIVSSLANIFWIFAWHYRQIHFSLIFMVIILLSLIKISEIFKQKQLTNKEKIVLRLPFSLYFGWISVVTIANVIVFLVSLSWNGFGMSDQFWMILVLFIGTVIGLFRMIRDKDIIYGAVFLWAYLGILIKHVSSNGFAGQYPEIIVGLVACLSIFLTANIFLLLKRKKIKKVEV